MEQYTVTGMSCAACTARVEKAVSGVKGVTSCSVSLLTNSMGVEGSASAEAIIAAVEQAGYGASLKGADVTGTKAAHGTDALEDKDTPVLKRRLLASLGFLAVLLVVWVFGAFLPWAFKGIYRLCRKPFDKRKERAAA